MSSDITMHGQNVHNRAVYADLLNWGECFKTVKIGVFGRGITDESARSTVKQLRDSGIDATVVIAAPHDVNCVIVLGGDHGVRRYYHQNPDADVPVLGVSEADPGGFLAQIDLKEIHSYTDRLKRDRYDIEEVTRLGVKIDGKDAYPVLNEVAVFSSKSAMLMEYTLRVNEKDVWHDSSDGIIVSTPIGSSAYSMSAGGPIIFQESEVFEIISVNSLDINRRPMIVPNDGSIEICNIWSRLHCVVILDGTERLRVRKSIECFKYSQPAKIIRVKHESTAISALAKKARLAGDLLSMPPSSKLLLKILEYKGALTQRELAAETMLPDRTVRQALANLLNSGHVTRRVSLRDARQRIYEIHR